MYVCTNKSTAKICSALKVRRIQIKQVRDMLADYGTVQRRSGQGKKCEKRTDEVVAAVKASADTNPWQSIRKMAIEFSMNERTMHYMIKDDLGMKSRELLSLKSELLCPKKP